GFCRPFKARGTGRAKVPGRARRARPLPACPPITPRSPGGVTRVESPCCSLVASKLIGGSFMASFARLCLGLRSRAGRGRLGPGGGPRLEALEDRTVPSISLPTAGTPGPVTLTGTSGNDQFIIRVQATNSATSTRLEFSDNGGASFSSAALSDVQSITVNG